MYPHSRDRYAQCDTSRGDQTVKAVRGMVIGLPVASSEALKKKIKRKIKR